ncbi:MAG: pyridoxal phosphate-dependent aminotransferase [Actinobacteria bacterium]|nr:pyridoxal phosphate-dependent aminotransferase [Actinomycetota bacterium]
METGALPVELLPSSASRPSLLDEEGLATEGARGVSLRVKVARGLIGAAISPWSGRITAVSQPAKPRISKRIAAIAESATLAVDGKAKALKAAGRPVIGFGAGEPDFPTPGYIVDAAEKAVRVVANHRYTPTPGLPELRQAIVAKTLRDSQFEITVDNVLVTNGGKQAVYQSIATIVDQGDEVILPAPYWTTYPECIRLAGGIPIEVFADETSNYCVSVEQLEAARTPKTKALIFCSPSNPTGSVYTPEQVRAIGEWALKHGIWIITDEIYEHLRYDGVQAPSLPVLIPELADQTIILNGVAKTYAMTGWRVGWMIGPKDVIKAATNLQSHLTSNVSNVAQRAAIAALTGDLSAVEEMKVAFDRRRKLIVKMLNEIDGFECPMPQGAFYVYPAVHKVLGREIRGKKPTSSSELATLILDEVEVAAVPGEAFGPSGYLRFSYALSDEDIVEGISRIKKLING